MEINKNEIMECDCDVIHKEIVEKAERSMPAFEQLFMLADFFKLMIIRWNKSHIE
jgi:hypothetical protein